jgi:hypothetical protein
MSAPEKSARVPGAHAANTLLAISRATIITARSDKKSSIGAKLRDASNQADLAGDAVRRRKLAGFPRLIELLSKAFGKDRIIERRPGRRPVAPEARLEGQRKAMT